MRRTRLFLLVALVVVLAGGLTIGGYLLKSKIGADTLTQGSGDWKAKLILITIDPNTGKGSLTAYNSSGPALSTQEVYVGLSPDLVKQNMYNPSVAGCGTDGQTNAASCMTSLGIYSAGAWTKPLPGDLSGEWFLGLSGDPVFGGDPVCTPDQATKDGKPCRHLGIHFTNHGNTHGCVGMPNMQACHALEDIIPDNSGAKVIVTDYALRGSVSPVDTESYDQNYKGKSSKWIDKGHFSSSSSVKGINTFNFGGTWIGEVAAPVGSFEITSGASGYKSDVSSIKIERDTGHKVTAVNGQSASLVTELSSILALDKTMMAMQSNYNMSFYENGYEGYYRSSSWDQTYMSAGSSLTLSIGDYYPRPMKMMNGNGPTLLADTMFGVFLNSSPWHDLGYGHYFAPPMSGKRLAVFSIDYNKAPSSLSISLDTSGLSDGEKASLNKWGVSIVKIKALNHTYNDYIGLNSIKGPAPTNTGGGGSGSSGASAGSGGATSGQGATATPAAGSGTPTNTPQPATPSQPVSPGIPAGNMLAPMAVQNTPASSQPSQPAVIQPVVWYNPMSWFTAPSTNATLASCQITWANYNTKMAQPKPTLLQIIAQMELTKITQQKAVCDSLYPQH